MKNAVSLGTVFVLNSVALLLFPPIGYALHMSQPQFGLWAALAIHDTSSVVGAAAKYGNEALAIGTTVKLARALWILPIALFNRLQIEKQKATCNGPGSSCSSVSPHSRIRISRNLLPRTQSLSRAGRIGLTVTLYLNWHRLVESYPKARWERSPSCRASCCGL